MNQCMSSGFVLIEENRRKRKKIKWAGLRKKKMKEKERKRIISIQIPDN